MPAGLRSRIALIVMLGVFLIPVAASSLRGLTHLLTCRDSTEIPFTLIVPESGDPVIVSSTTITRGETREVCGGLRLDLAVGPAGPNRVELRLPITNDSDYDWQGTVRLRLAGDVIPIGIGEIKNGQTASDTVEVHIETGEHQLHGSLLIGP